MDEKSRITGDCYVRICGSRGLKCPRPPDPLGNEARHLSGARFAEAKAATSCGQEVTNVAHPILCIPHQS